MSRCVYCGAHTKTPLACWSHRFLVALDPHFRLPDQWRSLRR